MQSTPYSLGLATDWLGKKIIHKEKIGSTQMIAHQLAKENTSHGTVVIADEQTKAVGRMNRSFYTPKNKGVWLSMVLRPEISPRNASQLTLLTATVLADVIHKHIGILPQIKWPNDVLINDKKISGILTEMQVKQGSIQYVVIGIGLNVNQYDIKLQENTKYGATSLFIETKKTWDIKDITQRVLHTFEDYYSAYLEKGFSVIKKKWECYGYRLGEAISLQTTEGSWHATFVGIAEDGALLTKTKDGTIDKIYSAEIDWYKKEL